MYINVFVPIRCGQVILYYLIGVDIFSINNLFFEYRLDCLLTFVCYWILPRTLFMCVYINHKSDIEL